MPFKGHDSRAVMYLAIRAAESRDGALGWIQIANFIVTGAMVIARAIGIQRALKGGPAAAWAPRLLALYGLGLVAAGLFVADPMNGFPPGAPAGP